MADTGTLMAGPRPTWKGLLKIALVQIPIKVFPATVDRNRLSLHQLHTCQTRITHPTRCATCDRDVPHEEIEKGFEFVKGQYVVLLPAELEAISPESTRIIDLTRFAHAGELEPYMVDRSYYLAADGPRALEALTVLRYALTRRVGIGKLAIYGREYLIAVRQAQVPVAATEQTVLMLHTLHHAAELRPVDAIDALQDGGTPPVGPMRLALRLVKAMTGPLDLSDFVDQYQADLRRLIDAKVAGEEILTPPRPVPPVIPVLTDALEQSLLAVSRAKQRS